MPEGHHLPTGHDRIRTGRDDGWEFLFEAPPEGRGICRNAGGRKIVPGGTGHFRSLRDDGFEVARPQVNPITGSRHGDAAVTLVERAGNRT